MAKPISDSEARREKLLRILRDASEPVSGTELAGLLGVSRQVVVQDIALLRAVNKNILSTNKGYILFREERPAKAHRTVKVCHTDGQIADELNTVVDLGGSVLDVVVEHEIYGQITVDLILRNRADVAAFVARLEQCGSKALNELTGGVHFHTLEADSEAVLDRIEKELAEKGYLIR